MRVSCTAAAAASFLFWVLWFLFLLIHHPGHYCARQPQDAFSVIEPDDLSDEDEEVQDAVNAIFAELLPTSAVAKPAAAVAAASDPAAVDASALLLDLPSVPTTQLPTVPDAAQPGLVDADQDLAARIAALAN